MGSLRVPAGQTIAVCGASGCGKSSLISLLLRFYDLGDNDGKILIDGCDVKTIKPNWLRTQIGVVGQEPVLFSGSIRENICYGLSDADIESETVYAQMMDAAKEANAHEFVMQFAD